MKNIAGKGPSDGARASEGLIGGMINNDGEATSLDGTPRRDKHPAPQIPLELDPAALVLRRVRASVRLLWQAVYLLDKAALECGQLSDCASRVAALFAELEGRPDKRPIEHIPLHIRTAARAWRRQHGRSY